MEWSIAEVARHTGVTSRALRHYDKVGLLTPTRVGANGYRYYDEAALVRLQRILLLRELGLGIPAIAEVLAGQRDDAAALRTHLGLLEQERERLGRQIRSVESTIVALAANDANGAPLMASQMFDGFDHTVYRDEVVETWGGDAWASGDRWWRSLTTEEQRAHRDRHAAIAADYAAARLAGLSPASREVQAIVARHVDWLNVTAEVMGAEVTGGEVTPGRLRGYGDMYVGDPRFARNYGGPEGAEFVRDAFGHYAEHSL